MSRARQIPALAPYGSEPGELATAYADLFLLNVYPYASVFLDPDGEMNGTRAQEMQDVYEQYRYAPDALHDVGAPDHIGLMLGLLAHEGRDAHSIPSALRAGLPYLLDWAPVLCLAVEREPAAHSFYRALASETRRVLFAEIESPDIEPRVRTSGHSAEPELELELELESGLDPSALRAGFSGEEISVRSIVHRLLCPARSGVFLSRARLGAWARDLGVPLPFGGRFDVGISLFEAAGVVDSTARLVDWLIAEVEEWDAAFMAWAEAGWRDYAVAWRARITRTARLLAEMRELLLSTSPT
ncbi:MAG TPA: molecular chaperone TorD family protein [Anaerolineae bacterium]|nr:molecular chaperone TorD family protein [Anaerolineae bacterium]